MRKMVLIACLVMAVLAISCTRANASVINVSNEYDGDMKYELVIDEQDRSFLRTALQPFIEKNNGNATAGKRVAEIMLRAKAVRLSKAPLVTSAGSLSWEGEITGSEVEFRDGYVIMELGLIKIGGQPVPLPSVK